MLGEEPFPGREACGVQLAKAETARADHDTSVIPGSALVASVVLGSSCSSPSWEDPFCRICHEGRSVGELLSPCECSGSLATVHRACLERWLAASGGSRCELCRFEFTLERLPKPLTEWLATPAMQHQRRALCGDALCFLIITPLASLSGWLCVQGAMDLYYQNSTEAFGLLLLTLALIIIYLFWTLVSLRYHLHLFRVWRMSDPRVRLRVSPAKRVPLLQDSAASKDVAV